jgi:G:T/U-mismatch repair DNA glycosylase
MPQEIHPFVTSNKNGKWYKNNNLDFISDQSFARWFVNENCFGFIPSEIVKCLFLGTFPAWEVVNLVRARGNLEFFYGSVDNKFWHIITKLTGISLTNENQIFNFLIQKNIGVTDIVKKTHRIDQSSLDKSLNPIEWNDLTKLKKEFTGISTIICTSGGISKINKFSLTSNGESNLNAGVGLSEMFRCLGFTTSGFNTYGYRKKIKVYKGGLLIWTFDLINLLSPSDSANRKISEIYNKKKTLQNLVNSMPKEYSNEPLLIKIRLLQWSYFLAQGCIKLDAALENFVNNNRKDLKNCFE